MKIFRAGSYENFYDLPLEVNWIMTERCNYRCSYCFIYGTAYGGGGIQIPQRPFSTFEQIKTAVKNIVSLNRPWYNVAFGGGEPTIHPHLFDAISLLQENLQERLNQVVIISNGSRNEELYKNIAKIAKYLNMILVISIHTDHVEMDHILNLIENLSDDLYIHFSLMFNPAKREMVHSIYKTLLEKMKNFRFSMAVVLLRDGDRVDSRYTQEDFDWQKKTTGEIAEVIKSVADKIEFHKQPRHVNHFFEDVETDGQRKIIWEPDKSIRLAEGMSNFKGMFCISHAAMLRIEETGLCKGMVCGADKFTCNIFEEDALLKNRENLIRAVKCPYNACGCVSNAIIPKIASEEEAQKFVEVMSERQSRLFSGEKA